MAIVRVRVRKSIKKSLMSCPNPCMKKKKTQKRAFRSNPLLPSSSSSSSSSSPSFAQTLAMSSPPSSSSASISRFSPPSPLPSSSSSSSSFPCHNAAELIGEDDDDEEFQSTASRPCTPTVVSTPGQSRVSPSTPPPGYPLPIYCKPHDYYNLDNNDDDIDEELKSTAASRRPCTPPPPRGFPLPVYDKPTGRSSDSFACARPHPGFCYVPVTCNLYVF